MGLHTVLWGMRSYVVMGADDKGVGCANTGDTDALSAEQRGGELGEYYVGLGCLLRGLYVVLTCL